MGLLDKLMGNQEAAEIKDITGLFDPGIKDVNDTRTLNENQALNKAIMEYQSPNNIDKREIFTFDNEVRNTPDFYLPYYWAATYHFDKGNFQEAKKILLEGIKNSNIKSVLCRRLGEYYFLSGDLDGALYWLFTTITADTGDIDYHTYLYLAYIYEAYGMKNAAGWMLRRARGISYKLLMQAAEYSQKKKENILDIARKNKDDRISEKLKNFYAYAKRNVKAL